MLTRTVTFSSNDGFKIMNLLCFSGMAFSTLKFTEGLISDMTPILWFVVVAKESFATPFVFPDGFKIFGGA